MRKHLFRQLVLALCLVSLLVQQQQAARAQAILTPLFEEEFTGVVNEVVDSAIRSNLARRGITVAANDATMASTEQYVGEAANAASYASAGLTAIASIAGAPVWLTAALGVGALAAVGGVAWGIYQLTQNNGLGGTTPDGNPMPESLSLTPSTAVTPAGPQSFGSETTFVQPGCTQFVACTNGSVAQLPANVQWYQGGYNYSAGMVQGCASADDCAQQYGVSMENYYCQAGGNQGCSYSWTDSVSVPSYTVTLTWNASNCVVDCNANFVTGTGGPQRNPSYASTATGTLSALDNDINQSMLSSAVPPQLLADMANQLWKDASAEPGYTGEPYSASNPITSADVSAAPETATWTDLLSAPAPVGSTAVPISPTASTSTSTGTGTSTGAGTGTTGPSTTSENDCTEFPNASGCEPLGTAPAAPAIPSSATSVSMSPWSIGPTTGTCPAPITVAVLGTSIVFDYTAICTFAGRVEPLVLALCALGAALIVVMGLKS